MLYAAYGSNLHPLRLRRRVPSARLLGNATLDGWSLRFHKRSWRDGSGKCTLVREAGRCAHLAVYHIAPVERPRLDRAEGLGRGYEHREVELPRFGQAFTYLGAESHLDPSLAPFRWYRRLVLLGCLRHGFPEAYVERVRRQPAVSDPDPGRRARHVALLSALD
jgi:gamma-glutamylcyclotransferase